MNNTNQLIGHQVTLVPDVKARLELDWDEGEIFATTTTDRGVAAHVVNPSTGEITPALLLEGLKLTSVGLRNYQNIRDTLTGKK